MLNLKALNQPENYLIHLLSKDYYADFFFKSIINKINKKLNRTITKNKKIYMKRWVLFKLEIKKFKENQINKKIINKKMEILKIIRKKDLKAMNIQ